MDYCSSCRRVLNGALVCPGCGAYAPDIAPPAAGLADAGPATVAGHAAAPWEPHGHRQHAAHRATSYPAGHYADPAREQAAAQAAAALFDAADAAGRTAPAHAAAPEPGEDGPQHESVLGPASIAPTLHRGRAARRRQLERWKKSRRRAAAATAVALFGGGLTVASMSHSGKGSPTAASAGTPVVPTSLHTDTAAAGHRVIVPDTPHTTAGPGAPHTGTTAHQPESRAPHPGADAITSVPRSVLPTVHPVAYTMTTHTTPTAAPTTASAPATLPATGSTVSTATAGTAPSGQAPATATQSPQPSQHPAQPATTTQTAPATPPQQQLCLLIVCLG